MITNRISSLPVRVDSVRTAEQQAFLNSIQECITRNRGNTQFGPDELAQCVNLSRSQLTRRLKSLTGFSPARLIRHQRLRSAAKCLRENNSSIKEVAFDVGFCEPASFTRSFQLQFGCSPSEYRESLQSGDFETSESMASGQLWLNHVEAVIEKKFGEESFSIHDLARDLHLSVSQLNRRLRKLKGTSAARLIRRLRLERAAKLIADGAGTIASVAHQCGFFDQAHFCRSFKEVYALSPSEYRQRNTLLPSTDRLEALAEERRLALRQMNNQTRKSYK